MPRSPTATDLARVAGQLAPGDRALVIGIDNYTDPLKLKGSAADAAAMTSLLTDVLGFRREEVLTLTNEHATRDMILAAFDTWLLQGTKPRVAGVHLLQAARVSSRAYCRR